jgi:hypothetical protein
MKRPSGQQLDAGELVIITAGNLKRLVIDAIYLPPLIGSLVEVGNIARRDGKILLSSSLLLNQHPCARDELFRFQFPLAAGCGPRLEYKGLPIRLLTDALPRLPCQRCKRATQQCECDQFAHEASISRTRQV